MAMFFGQFKFNILTTFRQRLAPNYANESQGLKLTRVSNHHEPTYAITRPERENMTNPAMNIDKILQKTFHRHMQTVPFLREEIQQNIEIVPEERTKRKQMHSTSEDVLNDAPKIEAALGQQALNCLSFFPQKCAYDSYQRSNLPEE